MYHRILVPLETLADPTPLLAAAQRVARAEDGQIVLFSTGRQDGAAVQRALRAVPPAMVRVVQGAGPLAPAILHALQQEQADLLILGSACGPGHDHPGHMDLTEEVVLATRLPVLLIREGTRVREPDAQHPFHALILTDGSNKAADILPAVLPLLETLAWPAAGDLHLFQVIRPTREAETSGTRMTMLPRETMGRKLQEILASDVQEQVSPRLQVSAGVILADKVGDSVLTCIRDGHRDERGETQAWDLAALSVLGPLDQALRTHEGIIQRVLHATTLPLLVKCSRVGPTSLEHERGAQDLPADLDIGGLVRAARELDIPITDLVDAGD